MEIVKSIQRIQEKVVEESSSNPSLEKRYASRLEGKGNIVEKEKEKEKFYEKRSINPGLVSSNIISSGVRVKADYSRT